MQCYFNEDFVCYWFLSWRDEGARESGKYTDELKQINLNIIFHISYYYMKLREDGKIKDEPKKANKTGELGVGRMGQRNGSSVLMREKFCECSHC